MMEPHPNYIESDAHSEQSARIAADPVSQRGRTCVQVDVNT
jgi:hypothetical protein